MKLRIGYELRYDFPQPTPAILTLNVHFTRVSDLSRPDHISITPAAPISGYRDSFGNWCIRVVLGPGRTLMSTDALIRDFGLPDRRHVRSLPIAGGEPAGGNAGLPIAESFLRERPTSRALLDAVGAATPGWGRVQAICDFVHDHICFGYEHARAQRGRRARPMKSVAASAVIMRIWPSHFAAR